MLHTPIVAIRSMSYFGFDGIFFGFDGIGLIKILYRTVKKLHQKAKTQKN